MSFWRYLLFMLGVAFIAMGSAVLALELLVSIAKADEWALRVAEGSTQSASVLSMPFGEPGKLVEGVYRTDIWSVFYLEGAAGGYALVDFGHMTRPVFEVSPGMSVKLGQIQLKVSQGVAYISAPQFVTHFSVNFLDNSGYSIGLERTHYSNGVPYTPSLDYAGLVLSFHF